MTSNNYITTRKFNFVSRVLIAFNCAVFLVQDSELVIGDIYISGIHLLYSVYRGVCTIRWCTRQGLSNRLSQGGHSKFWSTCGGQHVYAALCTMFSIVVTITAVTLNDSSWQWRSQDFWVGGGHFTTLTFSNQIVLTSKKVSRLKYFSLLFS